MTYITFIKGFQDKCDKIHLSYSLGLNLKNENVSHKNLFQPRFTDMQKITIHKNTAWYA